jgi:hypothetical protein
MPTAFGAGETAISSAASFGGLPAAAARCSRSPVLAAMRSSTVANTWLRVRPVALCGAGRVVGELAGSLRRHDCLDGKPFGPGTPGRRISGIRRASHAV